MEAVMTAARERVAAVWPAGRVWLSDEVPGNATTPYVAIRLSAPSAAHASGDGSSRSRSYWLAAQAFGRTSAECARAADAIYRAFDGHSLDVEGWDFAPPDPSDMASSQPASQDRDAADGGLVSMTYAIPLHAYPKES